MPSVLKIARRTWQETYEGPLPPDVDLLTEADAWIGFVVRWVCGPDPEPAYVPGTHHGEEG